MTFCLQRYFLIPIVIRIVHTIVIRLPEYWVTFASVKAPPVKMNESSVNWTEQCCQRPGGILEKSWNHSVKGG